VTTKRKALIIGDAFGGSDSAAEVLQRFGFAKMDEAPSLNAATARLRSDHFDLVVVAIDRLSAVEMSLLEREIRRDSSMLIGTAPKPDPDLILRGMRSGVQEFLVSPPDPTELAGAVDRLVRRPRKSSAVSWWLSTAERAALAQPASRSISPMQPRETIPIAGSRSPTSSWGEATCAFSSTSSRPTISAILR
jgi:DNA-binding NtrC family response regulator